MVHLDLNSMELLLWRYILYWWNVTTFWSTAVTFYKLSFFYYDKSLTTCPLKRCALTTESLVSNKVNGLIVKKCTTGLRICIVRDHSQWCETIRYNVPHSGVTWIARKIRLVRFNTPPTVFQMMRVYHTVNVTGIIYKQLFS